ncbi:MAG: Lpg1974 family pore-forming outer membrane protein [Bacillota bacterium]
MKKATIVLLCATVMFVVSAAPAMAAGDSPIVKFDLKYWAPRVGGEDESPLGIMFHGHDEEDTCHEIWQWVPLDPIAPATYIVSGELSLGGGAALGVDYWSVGAQDSFGSWTEPFDYEAYAPGLFGDEYFNGIAIWGTSAFDWWYDGDGDEEFYAAGSKKTSASALDVKYSKDLQKSDSLDVTWSVGLRKAHLSRSADLGIGIGGVYDGGGRLGRNGNGGIYIERFRSSSNQNFSLLGPQAGIAARKSLWGAVSLYGGVDLGVLFGNLEETGLFVAEEYVYVDSATGLEEVDDPGYHMQYSKSVNAIVPTLDLEVGLAYKLADNVDLTVGYYNSTWLDVPGPMSVDLQYYYELMNWAPGQSRALGYSGLTVGALVKF